MPSRKTDRRAVARRAEYLIIECVTPELDAGRYPAKRIVGDVVSVGADIFKEGHDLLAARVLYMRPGDTEWSSTPLTYDYNTDRWYGEFTVDRIGRWAFMVEAWTDVFGTWRSELRKKVEAGQDVTLELVEGANLVRTASRVAKPGPMRATLQMTAKVLEDRRDMSAEKKIQRALDDDLLALMTENFRPGDLTRYRRDLTITVDRERARFAAWYEMFPRSAVPAGETRHGTFTDAATQLPRIAELGFDVVYLPPIHPIGHAFRKGKNNSLVAEPDDVGSPWAIGSEEGGHTAIDPRLGSMAEFEHFVQTATQLGMDVALDYALQCSPDHPWVKEHPDWFHVRPDGTIKYAENPPKKYQDIVPINFWCADRQNLWNACRDVLLFWIERGVKTFRVDNPHTKAFQFWEWVIHEVQREHPDAIFFSEAFTRPKKMKALAKLGFTMSYTYFTWKNTALELREYLAELAYSPMVEYYRGNLFANTPDILNEYLVHGGRPAFRTRLLLAGTLLPLYGIYSGFELIENTPVRPGSEEYLDSEKYQIKGRDYDAPGNINDDVKRLNLIRREHVALQRYANLTFHDTENESILFYRKAAIEPQLQWTGCTPIAVPESPAPTAESRAPSAERPSPRYGDLLIIINTDPHRIQETMVHVPLDEMGIGPDLPYVVHDLLTGSRYVWRGVRNYVRLDPGVEPGHVFRVESVT